MNIEICKKCPNFPKHFSFYLNFYTFEYGGHLKLIGQDKKGHSTGCYFYLIEEEYNKLCNITVIYQKLFYNFVKPEEVIKNFINKECPYLFEHEVVDE